MQWFHRPEVGLARSREWWSLFGNTLIYRNGVVFHPLTWYCAREWVVGLLEFLLLAAGLLSHSDNPVCSSHCAKGPEGLFLDQALSLRPQVSYGVLANITRVTQLISTDHGVFNRLLRTLWVRYECSTVSSTCCHKYTMQLSLVNTGKGR